MTELPPGSHHPGRSQSLGVKVAPSFHRVRELGGRIHERSRRFVIATGRLRSGEGAGSGSFDLLRGRGLLTVSEVFFGVVDRSGEGIHDAHGKVARVDDSPAAATRRPLCCPV